ncbi:MAG: ACP phosphodiesterase [Cryomorphaceae bacterium]|nr:DUF479 domain-containing protein [Cryomorphaceae bacterium]
MNFLAHLVLSPDREEIMSGNFFADRVKGQKWRELPGLYAEGVLLHRRIDFFVDTHLEVRSAKSCLPDDFGLFRGVLLDVFWDHFLARDFFTLTGQDPIVFVEHAHRVLANHANIFHPDAARMVEAMKSGQWLLGYADLDHLDRILNQMSDRFPHKNPMGQGVKALQAAYLPLSKHFILLWKDLQKEFGET